MKFAIAEVLFVLVPTCIKEQQQRQVLYGFAANQLYLLAVFTASTLE